MKIAFTTKDKVNIDTFNNPILIIDTENSSKEEMNYMNAMKIVDVLVTSHLDGFETENVKSYGVTPVIYRGKIENAINDLKDCGITRTLPVGEGGGGCSTCGV